MRRWGEPLSPQGELAGKIGALIRSLGYGAETLEERQLLYADELAVRHGDSDWRERGAAALARYSTTGGIS